MYITVHGTWHECATQCIGPPCGAWPACNAWWWPGGVPTHTHAHTHTQVGFLAAEADVCGPSAGAERLLPRVMAFARERGLCPPALGSVKVAVMHGSSMADCVDSAVVKILEL